MKVCTHTHTIKNLAIDYIFRAVKTSSECQAERDRHERIDFKHFTAYVYKKKKENHTAPWANTVVYIHMTQADTAVWSILLS